MITKILALTKAVADATSNPTQYLTDKALEAARPYGVASIRDLRVGKTKFRATATLEGEPLRDLEIRGTYKLGDGYVQITAVVTNREWATTCLRTLTYGKRLSVNTALASFFTEADELI